MIRVSMILLAGYQAIQDKCGFTHGTELSMWVTVPASGDATATPEAEARIQIDRQLEAAGWVMHDYQQINLTASRGVAVREFPLSTGEADDMLFVDGRAAGGVWPVCRIAPNFDFTGT